LVEDMGDLDEFLAEGNITPTEYYFKNDFMDIISTSTNLSRFLILAIFYDIRGLQSTDDSISGKAIIDKLRGY
jgi:hypothetical protein